MSIQQPAASIEVTASSGNVFTDLGFSPEDAAIYNLRAILMSQIRQIISARGWTQADAGVVLGISQSRVSDLVRGKQDKFSLDMLVGLATRCGQRVALSLA